MTGQQARDLIYQEIADRLTEKYGPTNRAALQIRQWATEEPGAARPQILDVHLDAKERLRGQINYLVSASGIKQTWISERIGVSEKHLSQMLTGQVELTPDWAQRIAVLCGHTVSVSVTPAAPAAEETVTRVTALYERWVKAGAPPLGTSINRWWDRRLVELHDAIRPPADEPARTTPNNPPTSKETP